MNVIGIPAKHRNFQRSFQNADTNNIIIVDPKAEYASINATIPECTALKEGTAATNNAASANSGSHKT